MGRIMVPTVSDTNFNIIEGFLLPGYHRWFQLKVIIIIIHNNRYKLDEAAFQLIAIV